MSRRGRAPTSLRGGGASLGGPSSRPPSAPGSAARALPPGGPGTSSLGSSSGPRSSTGGGHSVPSSGHNTPIGGGQHGPSSSSSALALNSNSLASNILNTTAVRLAQIRDPSGRISEWSSSDDKCPQCKTDRFLNPKLRLLVSPCYHKLCESCLDRIFSLGPAPCPECNKMCRKNQFGAQTFADLGVEKEVDWRKRIGRLFNKREEDFGDLKAYNDYLEEVETITFNLINGIDMEATKARLAAYEQANRSSIASNARFGVAESEAFKAYEEQERAIRAERARARAEREEMMRLEREEEERNFVEAIGRGEDAERLSKQREERQREREREVEEMERRQEEEDRRRQEAYQASLGLGGSAALAAASGKKKGGEEAKSQTPWFVETLLDFHGPLAALDDARWAFEVRPAPAKLGGGDSITGASNEGQGGYDDPWISSLPSTKDAQLLRAGGYDFAEVWTRAKCAAVDGLWLAPMDED